MAKNAITDYSTTAASNTDVGGVNVQGTAAISNADDAFRELMSHLAETNAGTSPWADTMTIGDAADLTKEFRFEASGITAGQTRVLTVPDANITLTGGNPPTNDGAALGTTALGWSDLHLATGAVIDAGNGNAVITHSSGIWTVSTGDLRVTTAGTNAASVVTVGGTQTLTSKTLTDPAIVGAVKEDVYTITDGAAFEIDPSNGTIQTIDLLTSNRTPAATNFASGESVTLRISDGAGAYTITWSTVGVVWVGGSAPTLATSGYTIVELWKDGSTIYGAHVGDVAS